MRLLCSIAAILALLLGLGFWTNYSLQASTDELTQNIDQISKSMENQDWDQARKQTVELEIVWEEKARWWPIFLDHQEMDNIEFSLAKVKKYVSSRNNALAQGQLAELRLMIRHIPSKEAVNIENIL